MHISVLMTLEAGAVLARSYRLLHTIGEGGMGRVWVAEQLALERHVAVKVLCDEAIQSQPALDLFHREARATARVDSPHVIRVLDFDVTDQGWPFLVLELLTGETVEERVQRLGAFPLEDVREMLEQTCHALSAAHGCGILHRDIKAENLFLQETAGRRVDIKLLDFGIALFKSSTTDVRHMGPVGTPQYMSPEQMLAADVDERSDLFSLAVCAYYALTGDFPFQGSTAAEIACALSRGVFVPVSQLRPGLPAALDAWFERALAINPDGRFRTPEEMASAFARAIEPALRDTPVAAEMDIPGLSYGWAGRVWKTMGVVAALACTLVAVHAEIVARRAATHHGTVVDDSVKLTSEIIRAPSPLDQAVPPPPVIFEARDAGVPAASPHHVSPRRTPSRTHDATVIVGTEGFGSRE